MPWQERTVMAERQEFLAFAAQEEVNISTLCVRFGISRKTAYKWLARAGAGESVPADRSRRPHTSPRRTSAEIEAQVLALRAQHPAWGGRKLHHWLVAHGLADVPAPSTITAILRRHGLLSPQPPRRDWVRFVRETANELWQLDFMGHRAMRTGRVHPLTLLDDHSRYALLVAACANEQQPTVQAQLTAAFRRYGLPHAILSDNGPPWGTSGMGGITALEAWLLRLGIAPWHGRPYHPQTQGKIERFHGTLAAELFAERVFPDLAATQSAFDGFRTCYNQERPHEALDDAVPASRYRPSPRAFPEKLPAVAYEPDDAVCTVGARGSIQWQKRRVFISWGLVGQPVAVRPTADDGVWQVVFCQRPVATIDLRSHSEV